MNACIFCDIIAGKAPAHKVYEDDRLIAILDIQPINPGHVLVIPKQHVADYHELETSLYLHTMTVVRQLSQRVNEQLKPAKTGLAIAGWDVPHTHIHIIPMRHYNDISSQAMLEGRQAYATDEELAAVARLLLENTTDAE